MTDLALVVGVFAILTAATFALLPLRQAVVGSYLTGWLLLPVGAYPPDVHGFTIELIGAALPAANMLVTKAWIVPVLVLAFALEAGWRQVVAWRPGAVDLPMLAWCLWPFASAAAAGEADPRALIASAYLLGTWGAPWVLGRLFLSGHGGHRTLLEGIADTTLLVAPLAWAEGLRRPFFYGLVYGEHPFVTDGVERYVGFRALLFFENGNQFGIAIALGALAAIAAWRLSRGRFPAARAIVLVATAVASQSAGGIALLAIGAVLLLVPLSRVRPLAFALAGMLLMAAPVYVSGVIPVERLIRHTEPGQKLLALVRATGRGSFAWRVSQDQKVAPLIREHPLAGASRWDWWREAGARPWGLAMLVVGQFGLIGLLLAMTILLAPAVRVVLMRAPPDPATGALAAIALLAAIDGLLNAFVFLPAIAVAGACTTRRKRGRDPVAEMAGSPASV